MTSPSRTPTANASRWYETYEALRLWVAVHGSWPTRSTPGGPVELRLAHWVAFQRRQRASGQLAAERGRLLEAVPGWKAAPEEQWRQSYRELRRWNDDNGRLPARTAGDPDEARLGRWMDTQRRLERARARDGTGTMTPERERLLEAIPGWRWSPRQQSWRESYLDLTRWVATHGRLPLASAGDPVERHLAHWVSFQRELRRRRDDNGGRMSPGRQALLEAVPGWCRLPPRRPRAASWHASYGELTRWVATNGRFPSSSAAGHAERRLARWTAYQRSEKRRRERDGAGPMTPDRQARLEAIPGWEWCPLPSWEESFHELARWAATHGRLPSATAKDRCERRLGRWRAYQRELRRRWDRGGAGQMTPDRQALLETIPAGTGHLAATFLLGE